MQNSYIAHWLTRHFYRMSCHVAKQRSAYLCVGSALSRMLMRPAEKSAPWAARSSMTDQSNASDVTIFCVKIKNQINLSLGTRGMECLNPRLPYPFIHLNLWNPYPFIITPALIFYRGENTDVYHTLVDRQSRLNWVDEWSLIFFFEVDKDKWASWWSCRALPSLLALEHKRARRSCEREIENQTLCRIALFFVACARHLRWACLQANHSLHRSKVLAKS